MAEKSVRIALARNPVELDNLHQDSKFQPLLQPR